jgi:hypothetical protein
MGTIPIKLKDEDVHKIDYLIKMGKNRNRNQAIITMIETSLAQEPISFNESDPIPQEGNDKITQFFDAQPDFGFSLESGKSLADLVSEDRERHSSGESNPKRH